MDILDLPRESLHDILSFLPLEELHESVRPVCRSMREACDSDSRWLPIIAPPSLSKVVLSLDHHGNYLRRLYFKCKKWEEQWWNIKHYLRHYSYSQCDVERALRSFESALDGFFSLAPWLCHSSACYPTPWLHRMVYGQECPTKQETSVSGEPPRKRTRRNAAVSFDEELSTFFQQRVRSDDETFFTEPIFLRNILSTQPTRVIIQAVNFRGLKDGLKHEELPDLHPEDLNTWNNACVCLLEFYFGKGRAVAPPVTNHLADFSHRRVCRYDVQGRKDRLGRPVWQVNAQVLIGLSDTVLGNINASKHDKNTIVYVMAPHMYHIDKKERGGGSAWMLSTDLEDDKNKPRATSTFQLRQFDDPKERIQQYTKNVFCSVLYQLEGFRTCENAHCALNNVDSMEETEGSPLILCPACIRKLQLCGVLGSNDVPRLLRALHGVLSKEPFASVCRADVLKLEEYGVGSEAPGR